MNHRCEVELFDFVLPSASGNVPRRHSKIDGSLSEDEQIRWHYGQSWSTFGQYLDGLITRRWIPDSVWITTLASFWWQAVPLVGDLVKNKLKRPRVVLYGNYPVLETTHAARFCPNVDVIVRDHANLARWPADFSLYGQRALRFCALDLRAPTLIDEIAQAIRRGTTHFCFYNDNLFEEFDNRLKPVLAEVVDQRWDIRFHGICGVETRQFPLEHAQLLADAHFDELHLEPVTDCGGIVDEAHYRAVMRACEHAGLVSRSGMGWESRRHYVSGFLWVGRPDDDLEAMVWNALKILQLVGMVIPKPYSPTPGSGDHNLLASHVSSIEPEDISPHRLPFAGMNGIARSDYRDFYRMTAFLNRKVRGHTFDFLGDTFLARVVRQSLTGRRWDV